MRKTKQEYNKTYYEKNYDKISKLLLSTVTCPNCKTPIMYCNLSTHKKTSGT
jgi:hypothetical protein